MQARGDMGHRQNYFPYSYNLDTCPFLQYIYADLDNTHYKQP